MIPRLHVAPNLCLYENNFSLMKNLMRDKREREKFLVQRVRVIEITQT